MMLQRQVTGQRELLLSELFVFLFVLLEQLLRLVQLLFMFFQLSSKCFVVCSKLTIFLRQFFRPSMLCVARSKEIYRSFIPGSLVLTDRFWEKILMAAALLRLAVEKTNQYVGAWQPFNTNPT